MKKYQNNHQPNIENSTWQLYNDIDQYKKKTYLKLLLIFISWTVLCLILHILDNIRIQGIIERQGGSSTGGGLGNTLIFIWYAWAGGYFVIFLIFIYVNEQIKKYEKYPYLFYWRKYYYY